MKRKKLLFVLMCLMLSLPGCKRQSPTPTSYKPEILDLAVPIGSEGLLSHLPNKTIEEGFMQEIMAFQDKLLSISFEYDEVTKMDVLHLKIISLDSGDLLHRLQLPAMDCYAGTIQVCGPHIVVSDPQHGHIHIYDETLEEIKQYPASGEKIFVNTSITKAYRLTSTKGIHVLDLEDQTEEEFLKNTADLSFYSRSGQCITIRYIDLSTIGKQEAYANLNLDTGEIELLKQEPLIYHSDSSGLSTCFLKDEDRLLLTSTDLEGNQSMSVYQSNGTFLSHCSLAEIDGTLTSNPVWIEPANGYFFLMIDSTGHDQLYFWDLSQPVTGNPLDLTVYENEEQPVGTVLEQQYYERAKTLSETYGITIKIADQCSTDYGDMIAEQEYSPDQVGSTLTVLEQAISNYPDGFFSQLYYGSYRKIEINLMGTITSTEEIEGYFPIAFVEHDNGKIIMVLDINVGNDIIEQNFYHETSHMIDKVLEQNALYRADALYSEESWWSLNPKEFIALNPDKGGYFESYAMMPMEYYEEIFTSYFSEDYGKSFSTEDRATIFQTAMSGNTQIFSSNDPLYAKLQYYCQCIRDCFDTTGWPEYTAWEKALQ